MRIAFWKLVCAAWVSASPALAGSLGIDPVQLSINDNRRTASIAVTNKGDRPVTARVYPLAWSQSEEGDHYAPTDALIASPPVITIPAGVTHIVRVGFRDPSRARGSYRIIVEEVPQPGGAGVQVALRLNLPLFARMDPGAASSLKWAANQLQDGRWVVEATNPAAHYVRLTPQDFTAGSGVRHDNTVRVGVILPHARRQWAVGVNPDVANETRWRQIAREESGHGGYPVVREGQ